MNGNNIPPAPYSADHALKDMQVSQHQPPAMYQPVVPMHPMRNEADMSLGSVSVEEKRAIEEARAKILIAKHCPRRFAEVHETIKEACSRPSLAQRAFYSYPKGGQTVSGASIRLAEELARAMGNIEYGIRELSQDGGKSEMQAFCWDLERNLMSTQTFTVKHEIGTKNGPKKLTDGRDIYELTANMGSRRLRSRILAIIPPDLLDFAIDECKRTLAGQISGSFKDNLIRLQDAFSAIGVSRAMLESNRNKKIEAFLPEDVVELRGVYNSIKDGHAKAGEFFGGGVASNVDALNNEINKIASGIPRTQAEIDMERL
jgi:hypothetical protein